MRKKSKSKKKKKRLVKFFKISLLFMLLMVLSIATYVLIFSWKDISAANKEVNEKLTGVNTETFRRVSPTIVYDKDDKEIAKLAVHDFIYSKYEEIPNYLKYAFIATEDKDFFKHNGVSIKGLSRAVYSMVVNRGKVTQGGSTITQQLVKNVLLTQDRTLERKYTEMRISLQLEKMFKKEQILEFYVNNINYSNGAYSAASAAELYFNKPLNQLSLAEDAFIAAIPNNPTYYNPLKNYDHVVDRQKLMLKNMKEQKYITEQQYNEAINTKVTLNYQPSNNTADNYMTTYAIDCAVRAMMQFDGFDFKYKFASDDEKNKYDDDYNAAYEDYNKKIRTGGYKLYTSFDIDKQNSLQESLDNKLSNFKDTDEKTKLYKVQGAAVCIDNSTGQVIAMVGGRSQKDVTNYFNRAFSAVRQPGSAIKPLLVYGPAFDKGYTPDDVMNDHFIQNGPKNAENTFFGDVTLRRAIELSLNTIPYQLISKEGIQYATEYLYKLDFAHLVKEDNNPIISIGGFTHGATPVEMAGGYAALARGGEYIQPTCIRKITGNSGELLYENGKQKERIYKEETAYRITDVLKGVLTQPGATGYGLTLKDMPAAAKTGTTSESKDGWFAGYTPYLTTVVWVGADTPAVIKGLSGAKYPGPIWRDFMNKANTGLEVKDFQVPQSIKNAQLAQAQALLNDAEAAVSAYENVQITSKNDYDKAAAALQTAQTSVDKLPQDKKQSFLDRIKAKTDTLNVVKGTLETQGQNQTGTNQNGGGSTNQGGNTQNGNSGNTENNGTTNNNTNGSNNQGSGTGNNDPSQGNNGGTR